MLKILTVEDDENLRDSMMDALAGRGYEVLGADCAEALPELSELASVKLAIVDLNLPGEDGLSLVKRLKVMVPNMAIMILTARTTDRDRVAGYASGADMYLSKPITLAALDHAVRQVLLRFESAASPDVAA